MTARDVRNWIKDISGDGVSTEQSQNAYVQWADKYDEDLEIHEYTGPQKVANIVRDQVTDLGTEELRILDVGAGTGLVAKELRSLGFQHIDALDPSEAMLKEAMNAGLYDKYYVEYITRSPTSIPENSYDIISGCGIYAHEAHLPCEALYEMIRVVKPGGIIALVGRHHLLTDSATYRHLEPLMDKLETEGLWKKVLRETWPDYLNGIEGIAWCYKVL